MSNRVTTLTTTSACSDDSWESSDWAAGPVTPDAEVGPLDQRLEVGAQVPGVLDGGRVEGVLARLDLHEDRLHQAVVRRRGGGRRAQVVVALGVELLGDGGHLGLVVLGQLAAVLPVEDHDRADLTALGEGFLLHGERLDGLVVAGQELRLVLRGLQGGGRHRDDHGGHDPGRDDPPAGADDESSQGSEHGPNATEPGVARGCWRGPRQCRAPGLAASHDEPALPVSCSSWEARVRLHTVVRAARVTSNLWTDTTLRGCNPSMVLTGDGVVIVDTRS